MNFVIFLKTFEKKIKNLIFIGFSITSFSFFLLSLFKIITPSITSLQKFYENLIFLCSIALSSGILGKEIGSGTIQLLLVRPLRKSTIYISKILGLTLAIVSFILINFTLILIFALCLKENNFGKLIFFFLDSLLVSFFLISLITFFSSFLVYHGDILGFLGYIFISGLSSELFEYFNLSNFTVLKSIFESILVLPQGIDIQSWLKKEHQEIIIYVFRIVLLNFVGMRIFSHRELK